MLARIPVDPEAVERVLASRDEDAVGDLERRYDAFLLGAERRDDLVACVIANV